MDLKKNALTQKSKFFKPLKNKLCRFCISIIKILLVLYPACCLHTVYSRQKMPLWKRRILLISEFLLYSSISISILYSSSDNFEDGRLHWLIEFILKYFIIITLTVSFGCLVGLTIMTKTGFARNSVCSKQDYFKIFAKILAMLFLLQLSISYSHFTQWYLWKLVPISIYIVITILGPVYWL